MLLPAWFARHWSDEDWQVLRAVFGQWVYTVCCLRNAGPNSGPGSAPPLEWAKIVQSQGIKVQLLEPSAVVAFGVGQHLWHDFPTGRNKLQLLDLQLNGALTHNFQSQTKMQIGLYLDCVTKWNEI